MERAMVQESETIKSTLESYPFIKKFLGKIIHQRLGIECYTHGMLTANLLLNDEVNLKRLECILKLGDSHCKDFKRIFGGKGLSKVSKIADGQIIDLLAEVKAFEFLHSRGFKNIANVKRLTGARTVDFTAQANGEDYAIEVTRLGLAQSEKKQPAHAYEVDTISYAKCEDANGFRVTMITEGLNVCRLTREISDAIGNKYAQMNDFCQKKGGGWKGIIFISSGRDYFLMGKYENKKYEITPNKDFQAALAEIWKELKGQASWLSQIVITRGKDLTKAIMFPGAKAEE